VDDRRAVREFFEVLRPGGLLVLNLPAYEFMRSAHDQAVHTRHRYLKREVEDLFSDSGFSIIKVSYWNALLFPLVLLVRLLRAFRAHEKSASDIRVLPLPLNAILHMLLRIENWWLRHATLPLGSSVFGIAQKPE
jgi:SAM-dependent methyltransferase